MKRSILIISALLFVSFSTYADFNNSWPMPSFRFQIENANGFVGSAQAVSGLETAVQTMEYRHSGSALYSTVQMPGIAQYGNITLNRVVVANNSSFWRLQQSVAENAATQSTWILKLINENDQVVMQWQMINAWPTKIIGTDLKSDGNQIGIDTLKIAHEQIIRTNH